MTSAVGGLAAATLVGVALLSSDSAPHAVALARTTPAAACPSRGAARRAERGLRAAVARYRLESRGLVIHADLRRIARDRALLTALGAGRRGDALTAAERQLVNHVVRIRVLRGERVLLDANASSFDVAGSSIRLRAGDGRYLGRLEITVQDFIGYVKLMRKLDHVDVLVRGAAGKVHTSLAAAAKVVLPSSGCTRIGGRRYVVTTLPESGFAGEPVVIRLLTRA